MDEIINIARLDGRPWTNTGKDTKSVIPFALLFAAVETARYILNGRTQIPEFEKYFVIITAALIIVLAQDLGATRWPTAFVKRLMQTSVYVALISVALFDAIAAFLPSFWTAHLDPRGDVPDWLIRLLICLVISLFGVSYVVFRTSFYRSAEFEKLHARPSNHIFIAFRQREQRALIALYLIYYSITAALLSYLLIRAG